MRISSSISKIVVLLGFFCIAAPAWAQQGMPADQSMAITHVSGGVGEDERAAMAGLKKQYSFWLRTAARRSGEYVADARVRILAARDRQPLLDVKLDGPWLFADLAPGQYEIEVSFQDQTQRNIIQVRKGVRRDVIFYFDVAGAKANGPH